MTSPVLTPLDHANVIYDSLAIRLGFERQPGTRERLIELSLRLQANDKSGALRVIGGFDSNRQKALMFTISTLGPGTAANLLLERARNPGCLQATCMGIPFNFLETE